MKSYPNLIMFRWMKTPETYCISFQESNIWKRSEAGGKFINFVSTREVFPHFWENENRALWKSWQSLMGVSMRIFRIVLKAYASFANFEFLAQSVHQQSRHKNLNVVLNWPSLFYFATCRQLPNNILDSILCDDKYVILCMKTTAYHI